MQNLQLTTPRNNAEWHSFHSIREQVLWIARGRIGEYNRNHADDRKKGNYPKLLVLNNVPIGVMRIDFDEEAHEAIFRRVAITEGEQRKGYGRKLMEMGERFAIGKGCSLFVANVALDAVPFYKKLGYAFEDGSSEDDPKNPRMFKIATSG
jgi:GNAT superfamily N-acetyltransferase